MPEALRKFLQEVPDDQAEQIWEWLDGEPNAVMEIIEAIVDHHAVLLQKKFLDA